MWIFDDCGYLCCGDCFKGPVKFENDAIGDFAPRVPMPQASYPDLQTLLVLHQTPPRPRQSSPQHMFTIKDRGIRVHELLPRLVRTGRQRLLVAREVVKQPVRNDG